MSENGNEPTGWNEVRLRRGGDGIYSWTVSIVAAEATPEAMAHAVEIARGADAQLMAIYGYRPRTARVHLPPDDLGEAPAA
jgi:hypothetical protein